MVSRRDTGFALLIVLWSLVLISLLIAQLTASGRLELQRVANSRDRITRQTAVDGAIDEAAFHLLDLSPNRWIANGIPHPITVAGFPVTIRVTNEADQINPNSAPAELLAALLHQLGLRGQDATRLATEIVRWRMEPGPANESAPLYRQRGYLPPGTAFQTLDELALVAGMTPDLLARLRPHLQLFRPLPPLAATSDPVVAAALAEWSGQPPTTSGSALDASTVAITATSPGASRRAVVQLDPNGPAAPFQILAWQ